MNARCGRIGVMPVLEETTIYTTMPLQGNMHIIHKHLQTSGLAGARFDRASSDVHKSHLSASAFDLQGLHGLPGLQLHPAVAWAVLQRNVGQSVRKTILGWVKRLGKCGRLEGGLRAEGTATRSSCRNTPCQHDHQRNQKHEECMATTPDAATHSTTMRRGQTTMICNQKKCCTR